MSTMCKSAIYNVAEFYELFSLDEITNKVRVYSREWVALHVTRACRTCAAVLHAGEGHAGAYHRCHPGRLEPVKISLDRKEM